MNIRFSRAFVILAFIIILFSAAETDTNAKTSDRLSGADRYKTAVKISKEGWKSSETVIITTGTDFPDALAGAPLAYKENAPILLTQKNSLPSSTMDEIKRLKAKKAIILGSTSAVSNEVSGELRKLGINSIKRIGGKDRFQTAALIAEELSSNTAVIANGRNFPDALAISSYAARNGIPILLTEANTLPSSTQQVVKGKQKTIIVGGTGVVSKSLETHLPNHSRLAGNNRYGTAKEIITKLPLGKTNAYLASGVNFPDALAGSVLAAKRNAPIILTEQDELPSSSATLMPKYRYFDVIGGESAVSRDVMFNSKVKQIIGRIIKPGMTDLEKDYAVFRYMVENTEYDATYTRYSAYNALIEGSAVCDGYARATNILMQAAGLESTYVVGTVDGVGHAWNLVKVNGAYYHVDTTHNVFNQNDQTISEGREWYKSGYPKSNGKQVYPRGYDFFVIDNDIYYNDSYKSNSFGQLNLLKRTPDGNEKIVSALEPRGWLLDYENNWVYYASRGNDGYIYRKNLDNLKNYEKISYGNDTSYSPDDFSVRQGWIYIAGSGSSTQSIIRINVESGAIETLIEKPNDLFVPAGETSVDITHMRVADDWIYYSITTMFQEDESLSSAIKQVDYKMKHDGTDKKVIREYHYQ